MKDNKPKDNKHKEIERYRLSGISAKEIKAKYPDKLVDAYVEGERLVLVLDTWYTSWLFAVILRSVAIPELVA